MSKNNDKSQIVDSGGVPSRSLDALVSRLRHGCILRDKRWAGDTFSNFASGEIDEDATDDVMVEAADRLVLLQRNLRWYEQRVKLLQREQARFGNGKTRTLLCDILANGQMLPDKNGQRYPAPANA